MPDLTAARILADSTYVNGTRLITLETVFPRCILAEVNTHKDLSRNSASSRAIPVAKQIQRVVDQPWIPTRFPLNKPGMSATEYVGPDDRAFALMAQHWLDASRYAAGMAQRLSELGVHKQIANRLLEPFMWHTAILTATLDGWEHVFGLRCHPAAQPEFRTLAEAIRDAIKNSTPRELQWHEWHLPLIGGPGFERDFDLSLADQIRVSTARCARVSYLTHEGHRDLGEDLRLFSNLTHPLGPDGEPSPLHASPAEHPACPSENPRMWANCHGWMQARKLIELGEPFPGEASP